MAERPKAKRGTKHPGWAADVHRLFRDADIRQAGYVPDAGLSELIALCQADKGMEAVSLTSEQEGVALACGAWLGGQRSVLLMQSSGVGNCVNMLTIAEECRFPLLMIVTMRGEWGEFNPWQTHMGKSTAPVLREMGVAVHRVDDSASVAETVDAALRLCYGAGRTVAVLIGQRVVGFKNWGK